MLRLFWSFIGTIFSAADAPKLPSLTISAVGHGEIHSQHVAKTHVRLVTPDSEADFMASESMYSEVPLGASGNCKDHLICSPCSGDSRARTTIPTSWGKGERQRQSDKR